MPTPCSTANATEQFLVTDWNAFMSMEPNGELNEDMVEQIMKPSFNNLNFIEMQCSFNLSSGSQIHSALLTPDFTMSNNNFIDRNIKSKKRRTMSAGSSEDKEQKNVSPESVKSSVERIEKKQKREENPVLCASKSASKQAKEISQHGDLPKEEYIHVLAKRGQATNTHSLVERVRREKISERMRILQDLVPGCNKITGKAVMLDEIINYVQSLQRQVEFLSMKLVAVNPELNFDIEQLLHPRVNFQYVHGAEQIQPEVLMTATIPQFFSMTEIPNVWDEELQNAVQMGFIPQRPVNHFELNVKDLKVP